MSSLVTDLADHQPRPMKKGAPIYSATRIKTYMECGLQAYFKYVEKPAVPQNAAASFGKIVHKAMEIYQDTGDVEDAVELFKHYWANPEQMGATPGYWPQNTSWGEYLQLGIDTIRGFEANQKWDWRGVVGAEINFLVPLGEYWITGYIDALDLKKSGNGKPMLRVVDYKTAGRQPTKAELLLDIQFTIYLWAIRQPEFWMGVPNDPHHPGLTNGEQLWEQSQGITHRGIWYHMRTQKEIDVGPRDERDFQRLYRVMREIHKAIEADVHMPKIGSPCGLCDYKAQCPLQIPELERPSDEDAWL